MIWILDKIKKHNLYHEKIIRWIIYLLFIYRMLFFSFMYAIMYVIYTSMQKFGFG